MKFAKYTKKDFKRVSWEEYGKTLDLLYQKVNKYLQKNKIKIDAVVPILRGGAVPGIYLAYQLHILPIIPVQYKYYYYGKKLELKKHFNFLNTTFKLPDKPTFLLVEGNHCFGTTAQTAADDLKKNFPDCQIIYAADHIDYSHQELNGVKVIFYGELTNECRELSKEEVNVKGIDNKLSLFPWEDLEEEYAGVSCKPFDYGCEPIGETKQEINLD